MKADDVAEIARDVASDDLITARSAKHRITEMLTPSRLVQLISNESERNAVRQLVIDAYEGGNESVIWFVCDAIQAALKDSIFTSYLLVSHDADFIFEFIFSVLSHEELSIAGHSYRAAIDAMKVTIDTDQAHFIGPMIDGMFQNERSLRLFDCDEVFSPDNFVAYSYLRRHTHLLPFVTATTIKAFEDDLLLLANYLVVCGIISRYEDVDPELEARIHTVLDHAPDESIGAFCFRFCSIAVHSHDANANKHASAWVSKAVNALMQPSEVSVGAVCDFLASASSTQTGYTVLLDSLSTELLCKLLRNASPVIRHATLIFLSALCGAAHSDAPKLLNSTVMREVWRLHSIPHEDIQVALWDLLVKAIRKPEVGQHIAVVCASYLCGSHHSTSLPIRERQLLATGLLTRYNILPKSTQLSLKEIEEKGLYSPGSEGVATMKR